MRTRNPLKNLTVEVAKAKRGCHADTRHEIQPGEEHLADINDVGARENICKACAPRVLQKAAEHLAFLQSKFPH